MFCGTRSFSQVHDDPPSPKLKKSFSMNYKKKKHKNPYSSIGRDKFKKTLLELEEKKQKIMSKAASDIDYNFVRFTYNSESGGWTPIIIKQKKENMKEKAVTTKKTMNSRTLSLPSSTNLEAVKGPKKAVRCDTKLEVRKGKRRRKMVIGCCFASVVVLILFLLIFGRAFAICLMTIWWYLVPVMKNMSNKSQAELETQKKKFLYI